MRAADDVHAVTAKKNTRGNIDREKRENGGRIQRNFIPEKEAEFQEKQGKTQIQIL